MSQYPTNMQQQQQQQQFLMMQQMHMQQQYQYQQQLQQQQASVGHQHFGTASVAINHSTNQPPAPVAPREDEDPTAALDIKSKKWAQLNSKRSF